MTRYRWLTALCMTLSLVCGVSRADDEEALEVGWCSVQSGGGSSSVDDFMIEATVGQPAAGGPFMESSWSLITGFWAPDSIESIDGDDAGGTVGVPFVDSREFSLSRVYPNPSRGEATIDWAVPRDTRLRLTVHDVQGRQVAILADGAYSPGRYSMKFHLGSDRGGPAPGLYFVRLQSPDGVLVKRVIMVP